MEPKLILVLGQPLVLVLSFFMEDACGTTQTKKFAKCCANFIWPPSTFEFVTFVGIGESTAECEIASVYVAKLAAFVSLNCMK